MSGVDRVGRWLPVVLPVALAAYAGFEVVSGVAPGVGEVAGDVAVSAPAAVVSAAAVGLRRRPVIGLALSVASLVVESALTTPAQGLAPLAAQLALVYAVAVRCSTGVAFTVLVAAAGAVGIAAGDLMFVLVLFAVPWLAGRVLGERQRQLAALEVRSGEEAAGAVAEERQRIARDLHDVVSHALSLVVVQSQLAQATLRSDPPAAEAALVAVKTSAQQALADMRRMLGVLSDEAEPLAPQPGLPDLPSLLERVRAAGLEVRLREEGVSRELPPGISLTAYRVVQEGLTNVLRHAGSRQVEVVLAWSPSALSLRVRDRGGDGRQQAAAGTGRGLLGLRERVSLYGGTLRAGRVGEGFELEAVLPS